jgi:hypothetical protein
MAEEEVDWGLPCPTAAKKVCIFMIKALMVACKVSMACTSSQDPGQKGPWELQLSGAPGRDDDPEILVRFWSCGMPVSL